MRFLKIFLKSFFTIIVAYLALPYLLSPVYDLPEPEPFSGDSFYNPYNDIGKLSLYKGNFHCHSNTWGGIISGGSDGNSPENISEEYKRNGYDVSGISDYMSISSQSPVQVYEHGMGILKNHQLIIGASGVFWLDFLLPHKTNHKQYMLNLLKDDSNLVALAHPSWNNAYTPKDVKHLCNYDCFEILSTNRGSLALWDTALSAGKPVYLLANDDGHDALNPEVTGRIFNVFAAKDLSIRSVIEALKTGRNIGYEIPVSTDTAIRKKFHDEIILPDTISVIDDTLMISFKDTMKVIWLAGQGGKVKVEVVNSDFLSYGIKKEDTYLRCEAEMFNGTRVFLNPVIRGMNISNNITPGVNMTSTLILSSLMCISFLFAMYLFWRPKQKRL